MKMAPRAKLIIAKTLNVSLRAILAKEGVLKGEGERREGGKGKGEKVGRVE